MLCLIAIPSMGADVVRTASSRINNSEISINADQMHYDQDNDQLTASGHVEIIYDTYILHADYVSYNQNTGIARAFGNIAMLQPSGEVIFGKEAEFTYTLDQATIDKVGVIFPDNARFAAKNAQLYDGRYTVMKDGLYTSCNVCTENPAIPPLWQIRSQTITHDYEDHNIYFRDATIEAAGIPILYTPYMSVPDPTVLRRDGFLTPTAGYAANAQGYFVRTPYYFSIAPDKDLTLSPTFSTNDIVQFGTEYRQRFAHGVMKLNGSLTYADLISDTGVDEGQHLRGALLGNVSFDLNDVWRAGADVNFSSDKSYLNRYNISGADMLTNRAYLEGMHGRNYAALNSYYFQDLRPGKNPTQPFIMPEMKFLAYGDPGQMLGGRWTLNGGLLVTTRDLINPQDGSVGSETRRLSIGGGWGRQFTSDTGLVANVSVMGREDAYWADHVQTINDDPKSLVNNTLNSRGFYQGNITMRYPLGQSGVNYQHTVEPIVSLFVAPTLKFDPNLPNEDSQDVEFDETNLFAGNRFSGIDRIEGGSRLVYGLRDILTFQNGSRLQFFGGQSIYLSPKNYFPSLSGLENKKSDYVGRLDTSIGSWLNANYGFQMNESTYRLNRQEANLSIGTPIFRPTAQYVSAYQTETDGTILYLQEGTVGFTSKFLKYWQLSGAYTQEFAPTTNPLSTHAVLSYQNECLNANITLSNTNTTRRDLTSGTSVTFNFALKNVGSLNPGNTGSNSFANDYIQKNPNAKTLNWPD